MPGALVRQAGFGSVERFAQAVNARAWRDHGVRLSYDHVSVKRWIAGAVCQYPDVVAAVLADAWGIPIPVGAIWPEARNGAGPVPAHLQPWVAGRTLEALAVFVGGDMLTRRETLAQAIGIVAGSSFVDPIARWLDVEPGRMGSAVDRPDRIGLTDLAQIEQATDELRAADHRVGGGVLREAAVGLLKRSVDLARYSGYTESVGDRLLVVISQVANEVGFMSHDAGLDGPAQRYLVHGLQAAAESRDVQSVRFVVGSLANLARLALGTGRPDDALRFLNLALARLPMDRRHLNSRRATLWSLRAEALAMVGEGNLPEVRSAVELSFDLQRQAEADPDDVPWAESPMGLYNDAELASGAAGAFGRVATADRRQATTAEQYALRALSPAVRGSTGRGCSIRWSWHGPGSSPVSRIRRPRTAWSPPGWPRPSPVRCGPGPGCGAWRTPPNGSPTGPGYGK